MSAPAEFVLRMRSDRLAPAIQAGDALVVREAKRADTGQLVVVADENYEARVQEHDGEGTVVGVVTWIYRSLLP